MRTAPIPATTCPRCAQTVMVLWTPTGERLAVDPTPRPGGRFIVNGPGARIVGCQGRNSPDLGWWAHALVCPWAETGHAPLGEAS